MHQPHMWATADFVPSLKPWGPPIRHGGCSHPSPDNRYDHVYRCCMSCLRSIPHAKPHTTHECSAYIASYAVAYCQEAMDSADPRVPASQIIRVPRSVPGFTFVRVDKNPGSRWLICETL